MKQRRHRVDAMVQTLAVSRPNPAKTQRLLPGSRDGTRAEYQNIVFQKYQIIELGEDSNMSFRELQTYRDFVKRDCVVRYDEPYCVRIM